MLSSLEKGRAERDKDSLITILSPLKEKKQQRCTLVIPVAFAAEIE
jgi:hypothetical protein